MVISKQLYIVLAVLWLLSLSAAFLYIIVTISNQDPLLKNCESFDFTCSLKYNIEFAEKEGVVAGLGQIKNHFAISKEAWSGYDRDFKIKEEAKVYAACHDKMHQV
jgi:hypothetical protein